MSENGRDIAEQIPRDSQENYLRNPPPTAVERPTIHYSELPDARPDSPLNREWTCYRREAARLLAEGHEGRFVLIKGEEIIGIWDTEEEAEAVALHQYLMQPCLIHQVLIREPVLRGPSVLWRCPN